jgi:hypothetical protein
MSQYEVDRATVQAQRRRYLKLKFHLIRRLPEIAHNKRANDPRTSIAGNHRGVPADQAESVIAL